MLGRLTKLLGRHADSAPSELDTTKREPAGKQALQSRDRSAGDRARDAGKYIEAADAYDRHLAEHPDDFAIWVQLGHMSKQAGDFDRADAAYRAARALDPQDADLLLNHGHLLKTRGDLAGAAYTYRESFEVDHNADAARELTNPMFRPFLADVERSIVHAPRSTGPVVAAAVRTSPVGAVDAIHGSTISGWAADSGSTDPAVVVFFADDKQIGEATPRDFRGDIAILGIGSPLAGFEAALDLDFGSSERIEVSARLKRTGQELSGSPIVAQAPPLFRKWLQRKARLVGDPLALVRDYMSRQAVGRLSIVMPVYNVKAEWLREAIASVCDQWYDDWELICVDDRSPRRHVRDVLDEFAARDNRVRPIYLDRNVGIAAATNRGIAEATGDYIGFMDHDDYLEPDAAFRMMDAAASGAELIYSDEAITGESIHAIEHVAARAAFSHDYYLSHPYFVHFIAVRVDVARRIGGLDEGMRISADVDFVLRVIEQTTRVAHVPAVLYRWRTHGSSTGHARKADVTEATIGALWRHMRRLGQDAAVSPGLGFNNYRVDWPDDGGTVLIVIPTKNRHDLLRVAIDSVRRTTAGGAVEILVIDHDSDDPATVRYLDSIRGEIRIVPYSGRFNYARMNNVAVQGAVTDARYVLFLNNDIEAIEPGWLERMRSLCGRPEVGVVGATLIYGNRTIQHSGVVMGLGDLVDHAHKFLLFEHGGERNRGYNLSLSSTRDYSAVTGACMMIRRELFLAVGGFDETLEIGYNDTDLCLRLGALGFKILNDPYAVLYHHESATRANTKEMDHPEDAKRLARRWSSILLEGDPFYNPLLVQRPAVDHSIGSLDNWYAPTRVRSVDPPRQDPATMRPERLADRQL